MPFITVVIPVIALDHPVVHEKELTQHESKVYRFTSTGLRVSPKAHVRQDLAGNDVLHVLIPSFTRDLARAFLRDPLEELVLGHCRTRVVVKQITRRVLDEPPVCSDDHALHDRVVVHSQQMKYDDDRQWKRQEGQRHYHIG